MNSLPKTVTRQRRSCDLNPGPSAPESSTLTTRLPSHCRRYDPSKVDQVKLVVGIVKKSAGGSQLPQRAQHFDIYRRVNSTTYHPDGDATIYPARFCHFRTAILACVFKYKRAVLS